MALGHCTANKKLVPGFPRGILESQDPKPALGVIPPSNEAAKQ